MVRCHNKSLARAAKRHAGKALASLGKYGGQPDTFRVGRYTVYNDPEGYWRSTLDPESVFDTSRDAIRFTDTAIRRGMNPQPEMDAPVLDELRREPNPRLTSVTGIQDQQIAAELAAIHKHGWDSPNTRKVIFSARTRAKNALVDLGFTLQQAKQVVTDAADMVWLELDAKQNPWGREAPPFSESIDIGRAGYQERKRLEQASGINGLRVAPAEVRQSFNIWWRYEGQQLYDAVTKTQAAKAFNWGWYHYGQNPAWATLADSVISGVGTGLGMGLGAGVALPYVTKHVFGDLLGLRASKKNPSRLGVEVGKPRTTRRTGPGGNWYVSETVIEVRPVSDTSEAGWDQRMYNILLEVRARRDTKAGEQLRAPGAREPMWGVWDARSKHWLTASDMTRDEAIRRAKELVDEMWDRSENPGLRLIHGGAA